jgi:hypothetical protein
MYLVRGFYVVIVQYLTLLEELRNVVSLYNILWAWSLVDGITKENNDGSWEWTLNDMIFNCPL